MYARRPSIRQLMLCAAGALLPLTPRASLAQQVALRACDVSGLTGVVLCGRISVPENRRAPQGRRIEIAIVVARATGAAREPDPFVLLAGGPGQAGTEMGPFATQAFSIVRERRDLVLLDARGTASSNGLRCALMRHPADLGGATMYPAESVAQCRDSLGRTADLTQYTTQNIADDLEDVRRAFGWPAINIYGTSYGSRLAFEFLRRHESSVRTIVMKAVAPPTLIAPMNYAQDADSAFDLLLRDCRAEPACAAMSPDIRADLERVLARAAAGDVRAAVPRGPGEPTDTVRIERDAVAGLLVSAMQSVGERAQIPALLRAAAGGNSARLAALVVQTRRLLDERLFIGMHLSVACADDGRWLDLARARRDDSRTYLGSSRVRMLAEACAAWPVSTGKFAPPEPVRSNVPVLLVSGELDPNTPPRHAADALRTLPSGRHVILRGVAHGWSNVSACGARFVADFVARASTRDLDVACADSSSAPPFRVPGSGR